MKKKAYKPAEDILEYRNILERFKEIRKSEPERVKPEMIKGLSLTLLKKEYDENRYPDTDDAIDEERAKYVSDLIQEIGDYCYEVETVYVRVKEDDGSYFIELVD